MGGKILFYPSNYSVCLLFLIRSIFCQVWWFMPVIPELGRPRQEDYEFKASLGYMVKHFSKTNQNKPNITRSKFQWYISTEISLQISIFTYIYYIDLYDRYLSLSIMVTAFARWGTRAKLQEMFFLYNSTERFVLGVDLTNSGIWLIRFSLLNF